MHRLLLASSNGLVECAGGGEHWEVSARSLAGYRLTSVAASSGLILAGTADGVWRSEDGGGSWQRADRGLTTPRIRWLTLHSGDPVRAYVGTEPAAIFVSDDRGRSWRLCPEVVELRDQFRWSLPYSPEAGCIRGFAFLGRRGYAAAEVGGVLRSDDAGGTWILVKGSARDAGLAEPASRVHPDVHSVAVHPSTPDLVLAPTGGGLYRSSDGGATWQFLYDCYCRAVWIDPNNPRHIILGPADGVDRMGRIEVTHDGGATWAPASAGLKVPWPRTMVERFLPMGEEVLAILSNGDLYAAPPANLNWRRILLDVQDVSAAAELPS